jgi:hypothetical protein
MTSGENSGTGRPGGARAVTTGKIFLKHPAAQETIRVYENSFLSADKSNARFIIDAKALNAALVVAAREELVGQPTWVERAVKG